MNFLSNLFRSKTSIKPVVEDRSFVPQLSSINAKEKQLIFIKELLKPLLKAEGYRTAGNKWWKINGAFFNLIEIQNFSWNSRNSVDFCFNFTTGFTNDISNSNKPTIFDGITQVRENYFGITKSDYWKGANSYHIENDTDLIKFGEQVANDFKLLILPKLNLLTNKKSIEQFYSDEFWGPRVKQSLALGHRDVRIDA